MKAIIKTFAQTPFQYQSAKAFNLENSKTMSGQLICWQQFNTLDDARKHLHQIARELYSDEPISKMMENLWPFGLSYDAAIAKILVGSEADSFIESIK